MKRNLSKYGVTAALVALACSHASGAPVAGSIEAQTLPPFLSAGAAAQQSIQCQPVDDDVLSHQTGKYAGSDMISGFVLNLLSEWQLPNGATAVAQGALSVAQNTSNQLSAQVQTYANVVGGNNPHNSGANPNASATGGQNVAVNGISQVTQVAGNGNVGVNGATIDYSNNAQQLANIAGASNQSSAFATNANGNITAGITFANNSINVSVQTPAGIATQSIVPGSAQQAGAIAQLLQIAGNNQQVSNQLALSLQTQQMNAAMIRQTGVLQALRNIH
ncbi:peptidase C39 [Paraburkholderia sp. J12]|uniref:peptidase C39 n=1 Tax=Paraburkholderia sp. J12 TaxID=2805432 RepID=UPI002ABE1F2A|nr:peptidase C39 [Paraburkholderia sp. J12]